ncbi:hypothetical protein [Mariniflexile sp. HMF6888]|uniref:hypothetical protein n=1 Tax=Mariniflexile sp. HMF6888 TaxID=3373086 RepID=UPI00379CA695
MPKPAQYVRKVKRGDSINVYSKSFNVDEKGLRKAQEYEKNSSTSKVSGERQLYEVYDFVAILKQK